MANRTPLMAGNWKMNLNHVEATGLVQKLAWTLADHKYNPATTEAAVIVPFTDIRTVQTLIEAEKYPIAWGAQDVSVHASGAYTGEISADMLAKLGCRYVVVGHSERREYHAETDEIINAKAKAVIGAGMTPIICCGEVLEIRKEGRHVAHVLGQVTASGDYIESVATAADGSQNPVAILADYADASGGAVIAPIYLTGEFNQDKLVFDASWTVATLQPKLRPLSIFLKSFVSAADPT